MHPAIVDVDTTGALFDFHADDWTAASWVSRQGSVTMAQATGSRQFADVGGIPTSDGTDDRMVSGVVVTATATWVMVENPVSYTGVPRGAAKAFRDSIPKNRNKRRMCHSGPLLRPGQQRPRVSSRGDASGPEPS